MDIEAVGAIVKQGAWAALAIFLLVRLIPSVQGNTFAIHRLAKAILLAILALKSLTQFHDEAHGIISEIDAADAKKGTE